MNEQVISKLQKLLALAGSDNPNEAALAMERAQALMCEHNLSLADVALDGSGAYVQEYKIFSKGKTLTWWECRLGGWIAEAFDGQVVRTSSHSYGSGKANTLHFIATRTDLAIIVDLFGRLRDTINRQAASHAKAVRRNARRAGKAYRAGMLDTLGERLIALRDNTRPAPDSRTPAGLSGTELLVIKDKAVMERLGKIYPRLSDVRQNIQLHDRTSYAQGLADGHKVNLHRSVDSPSGGPAYIGR